MKKFSLEGAEIQDNGCRFYRLCKECPYPDCLISSVTGRTWLKKKTNQRLVVQIMREQGFGDLKIAMALGISSTLKYILTGRLDE